MLFPPVGYSNFCPFSQMFGYPYDFCFLWPALGFFPVSLGSQSILRTPAGLRTWHLHLLPQCDTPLCAAGSRQDISTVFPLVFYDSFIHYKEYHNLTDFTKTFSNNMQFNMKMRSINLSALTIISRCLNYLEIMYCKSSNIILFQD